MFNLFKESLWAIQPEALEAYYMALQNLPSKLELRSENKALDFESSNNIAKISIVGIISKTSIYDYSGEKLCTGLNEVKRQVETALNDPSIKTILLDFYSPGGTVSGVKEFADFILAAKQTKPCIAYVDGLCCSAAYWIASACGEIYAPLTATVGSIGVLTKHADFSKMNEKFGISYTYIAAGEYKTVGNPDYPLSEQDQAVMQKRVDTLYSIFVADVAKNMNISSEHTVFANGRDFLASEAKELGLITEIVSNQEELIQKLGGNMSDNKLAEQTNEELMSMVKLIAGEEACTKISNLLATGMTASQASKAMEILATNNQTTAELKKENDEVPESAKLGTTAESILLGIQSATPKPVGLASPLHNDETASALARIAKI